MPAFQCCFCGTSIAVVRDDPVEIHISAHGQSEESQQLRAHALCLRRAVHRDVPLLARLPNGLDALPIALAEQSSSLTEIILPPAAALEALDFFEKDGVRVLGWEGLVRAADGRIGHENAPQGAADLSDLSLKNSVALCRDTIQVALREWQTSNRETGAQLLICISAGAT